jgi:uncharacterized hydrophobic protein (TIGR00271 family)
MIHLRLVVPPDRTARALSTLESVPSVCNIVRLERAARRPDGDLVLCDVAREDASLVVEALCDLGIDEDGSIALEEVDTAISRVAKEAEKAAVGAPADAVVWEEVDERTAESGELSFTFLAFMVLAALIASIGIMTDSQILIVGAMVVGPEFGPLAGLCIALVQRRPSLALRSLLALAVGFSLAIAATFVSTAALRATETAPERLSAADHPATLFIASPDVFSFLVALFAGAAGILSLTTSKSSALVGVLISVTTIPAAANVGVAAAYGNWGDCRGALAQLLLNLGGLVLAGTATAGAQRLVYARRHDRFVRERAAVTPGEAPR